MSVKYSIEERERLAIQWIKAFDHLTSEKATNQEREKEHNSIKMFFHACTDNEVSRRIEALNTIGNNNFLFEESLDSI